MAYILSPNGAMAAAAEVVQLRQKAQTFTAAGMKASADAVTAKAERREKDVIRYASKAERELRDVLQVSAKTHIGRLAGR